MIYIEKNKDNYITYVNYMPLDDKYGLGKSEEELMQSGYLVEEIPEPTIPKGHYEKLKINVEDNSLYYEYEVLEKTEEALKIESLEKQLNDTNMAIMALMDMQLPQ